jgi:hypothetical protein
VTITPTVVIAAIATSTRQVRDQPGQEQQHERHGHGRHDPGDLAARSHCVVDGGARAAGADRQALGDAGDRARGAHRHKLGADRDVLIVAAGERACRQHLVGEAHEEEPDRGGREREYVVHRRRRDPRARKTRGQVPDHGHAGAREIERRRGRDRQGDDHQGRGHLRRHRAQPQQHDQRDPTDRDRRAADRVDLAHDLCQLRQGIRCRHGEPE